METKNSTLVVVMKLGEVIKIGDTELLLKDISSRSYVRLVLHGPRQVPIEKPKNPQIQRLKD